MIHHPSSCGQRMRAAGHPFHSLNHILPQVAGDVSPVTPLAHMVVEQVLKMVDFGSEVVAQVPSR